MLFFCYLILETFSKQRSLGVYFIQQFNISKRAKKAKKNTDQHKYGRFVFHTSSERLKTTAPRVKLQETQGGEISKTKNLQNFSDNVTRKRHVFEFSLHSLHSLHIQYRRIWQWQLQAAANRLPLKILIFLSRRREIDGILLPRAIVLHFSFQKRHIIYGECFFYMANLSKKAF